MGLQQGVDLGFHGPVLVMDGGQGEDDDVEGTGARDHDTLFVECVEDVVDQPLGHVRGLRADQFHESAASCSDRDQVMLLNFDPAVVGISPQPTWLFWSAANGWPTSHAPDYFANHGDGTGPGSVAVPDRVM